MSTLTCKKCNCTIVAKDITPKYSRQRVYQCPICSYKFGTINFKYVLGFIGVLFGLWIVLFFNYHISEGHLKWTLPIQILAFIFLASLVASSLSLIKYFRSSSGSKKWLYYSVVLIFLFLLVLYIAISSVWGL